MGYCPLWVISVVSAHATRQYISGHVPLLSYASQYSNLLSKHYENTSKLKLMAICEEFMNFLVDIDAEDVFLILDSFIFYRTTYEASGERRKIKTLFKNSFAAVSEDPSLDEIVKSFKVYTYRYRSSEAVTMPDDWRLQDVDKIGWLGDLFDLEINFNSTFTLD